MMYSCALQSEAEGSMGGDLEVGPTPGDLEAAQRWEIHHVLCAVCENQTQISWIWQWMGRSCHWGMCAISNLFLIHQTRNSGCVFFWMQSWYIDTIKRIKLTHNRIHQRGWSGALNQSPPWLLWKSSQIWKGLWCFCHCRHAWGEFLSQAWGKSSDKRYSMLERNTTTLIFDW